MGLPFMLLWNDYGEAPSQGGSHAVKTNQEEASVEKASGKEEASCQEAGSEEEVCCQETRCEKACE